MYHLREYVKIKNENPLYSLIALEFMKGFWKNPLKDIEKGKVSMDKVIQILNMSYQIGVVDQTFYQNFVGKLSKI